MKILSIDTSCDETAAAVTDKTRVLSNIIWSQASLHAKFGGVMPSLAQRMHEERIDWVVDQALKKANTSIEKVDAISVTVGPGLSIALGVGVKKAKLLAKKYNKKLIAINHLEAHILSPLANSDIKLSFPALGLVVSGGNSIFVKMNSIESYEILSQTTDDALGEALDKGARMLGLGYPGGAILEKMARLGNIKKFLLPIPIVGQEKRKIFTYSGLKTAMGRLVKMESPLNKQKVYDLAASFQNSAFTHLFRVCSFIIKELVSNKQIGASTPLLVGGGVSANIELRRKIRKLAKENGLKVCFPYSKKLTGDNAGMIGVSAYFKFLKNDFVNPDIIDRDPNLKITQ